MTLREYLAVPYVLCSDSIRLEGGWIRRVAYPELPGCLVEGFETVRMLDELDALRVRLIVSSLERGERPPVPRPPLPHADVEGMLTRLGLDDLIPRLREQLPCGNGSMPL
ncbi:MAG: hypothetical protein K6T31_05205 [Alicyclobacillus sp.]|nr:hypothetical protein [Alicyclobacillus sp.]